MLPLPSPKKGLFPPRLDLPHSFPLPISPSSPSSLPSTRLEGILHSFASRILLSQQHILHEQASASGPSFTSVSDIPYSYTTPVVMKSTVFFLAAAATFVNALPVVPRANPPSEADIRRLAPDLGAVPNQEPIGAECLGPVQPDGQKKRIPCACPPEREAFLKVSQCK